MDIQKQNYICKQLDELEKTIEKLEDGDERNKLIKKAYELIELLEKVEEYNKTDANAIGNARAISNAVNMGMFKYLDGNVRLVGQYNAKPKVENYRDRFDRFKTPTKNIL